MASRIERQLASKVFKLQKTSGGVPPEILAAARRLLQRADQAGDGEAVRRYLGISRGGGTALKGALKTFERIQGAALDITRDIELIQSAQARGQDTGIATTRLLMNLNTQVQDAIKSKWAKAAAEKAVQMIGAHPVWAGRIMYSIARIARLGGAAAAVVQIGGEAAISAYRASERYFKAQIEMADRRRLATLPEASMNRMAKAVRREVEYGAGIRGLGADLGLPWFEASLAEEEAQLLKAREAQRLRMVQAPEMFGVSTSDALSEFAKYKGKLVSELTERERTEAIERKLPLESTMRAVARDSGYVAMRERQEDYWGINRMLFPMEAASAREKWIDEYLKREEERKTEYLEIQSRMAEKKRMRKTPEELFAERERRDFAAATWMQHRSRHRFVNDD